jgi:hypothetical protein
MSRIRFNIANLLVVVLLLAVGVAALRESSDLWESGILSLTLTGLLVSILFAVHRTEKRRAFWTGFALFGWGYLALSLVPSIESRLITTKALAYLDSKVPGRFIPVSTMRLSRTGPASPNHKVQSLAFTEDGNLLATSSPGVVGLWDATTGKLLGGWIGTTENFIRIGHSLFALLVGWCGGLLSRRLHRGSQGTDVSTPVSDEGTTP